MRRPSTNLAHADSSGGREARPQADEWFDGLAEGVVLHRGGSVTDLNRAAADLLEVDRGAAHGAPLMSVLRDHRLKDLVETAARGEAALEIDLRGKLVEALAVPGAILLRDLSELRTARRDARELLAVLSHELRTPAAAIRAVLDAVQGALPPDGAGEQEDDDEPLPTTRLEGFIQRAMAEADRITRLLGDLTADVKPPRARTIDLATTVARAVAITESVQLRHAVSVKVDDIAAKVFVDEDKLLQALVNLIENAAVHGPEGGTVEVAAVVEDETVTLEVRDQGEPLPPGLVETLFEPRSQGGGKNKGTGLGLYIVRSLASSWGGKAWGSERAAPAHGNVFAISLPASRS